MSQMLHFSNYKKTDNELFHMADLYLENPTDTVRHTHDFYEFFVIIKGEFKEICNGQEIILKKGDVRLVTPETEHGFNITGKENKNILRNIAFEENVFNSQFKIDIFREASKFRMETSEFLQYINKTDYITSLSSISEIKQSIFTNVLDDILFQIKIKDYQNTSIPEWLRDVYTQMLSYKNYMEGIPRFLEIAGVTHSHLCREFSKYYKMTPVDFINKQKLLAAATMLKSTNNKIIHISEECGFDSITYFNRLFLRYYGLTPSEYRKLNREIFN